MSLFPEQLRALAYARKRGTDSPLHDIVLRVSGTFSDFESLVDTVPPQITREHRSVSSWCIHEVVDHLVESDRLAAEQLATLLAGLDVAEPIPTSLQSADPHAVSWPTLLQQFRTVHENIIDALGRAADSAPLIAKAPVQMVVKCASPNGSLEAVSWVERFDWKAFAILLHAHNREHIAQVHRILNAPSERQ
jgi:hypothetical protein